MLTSANNRKLQNSFTAQQRRNGTDFLAEKDGCDKKFALKIIKCGIDTESVLKRFALERQIFFSLEHPNIAQLLHAGSTYNDLPSIVGKAQDKLGRKKVGRENVEKCLNLYLNELKKYENLAADIVYAPEFLTPASDYYVANTNQKTLPICGKKNVSIELKQFCRKLRTIAEC